MYIFDVEWNLDIIIGLKLEVFNDGSFFVGGLGCVNNGNFVFNELMVVVVLKDNVE